MSYRGVGSIEFIEETMNAKLYKKILKRNLLEDGSHLIGENFIFQRDNDPKHTSKKIESWISKKGINLLSWPPYSPDLSPIENGFSEFKRNLKKKK